MQCVTGKHSNRYITTRVMSSPNLWSLSKVQAALRDPHIFHVLTSVMRGSRHDLVKDLWTTLDTHCVLLPSCC